MKNVLVTALVAGITLTACKKTEEIQTTNPTTETTETVVAETEVPTGDTTQTSVDWNGTYTGTLPCASCPGIETKLVLNDDGTYTLDEKYLEEKDSDFLEKGTFSWSADGSFVTLSPEPAEKDGMKKVFFVTEGSVYQVSNETDRSLKEEYKLTKQ